MLNETIAIQGAIDRYNKLFNILLVSYFGEETEIIRKFNLWKRYFEDERLIPYINGNKSEREKEILFDELHDMIHELESAIKKLDAEYGRNTNINE